MPLRYRTAIFLLGAFLFIGGAFGMVFAFMGPGSGALRLRAIVGATVALTVGANVIAAGYSGRVPRWLTTLFGDPADSG